MAFSAVVLVVVVGIAAIVVAAVASRGDRSDPAEPGSSPAAVARRVYLYAIAFIALGMLVTGLAGLVQAALQVLGEAIATPVTTIGRGDIRGQVSSSGATGAIGLIGWLIHWVLAERPVRRGDPAERRSGVRKLFLYGTLFIGGLILTFTARSLLVDLLLLAFGESSWSDLLAGEVVEPLSFLLVGAIFWAYYARVARRDRAAQPEQGAGATLRRWYTYGLSFVGLFLLLFGATGLLSTLWQALVVPSSGTTVGAGWLADEVAGRVGSIASGLVLWWLAWTWSAAWFARADTPDPESRSTLRKVYLYLVLAIVVARTVWNLGLMLYQGLRMALIADPTASGRSTVLQDAGSSISIVLVFGLAWLYHARVVEREAALAGERGRQAAIRRIYGYLVALIAAATFAIGLGGILATLLDLLVQPAASHGAYWWQERLSLFATLIVVGLPIWLRFWARLQREAAGSPDARQSLARRVYLFVVFGAAVLTLLGSGAYTLYQVIRFALGDRWTAGQTSELIAAASAAATAGLLLGYHFRVFRQDAALAPAPTPSLAGGPPARPAETVLVIRASTPAALAELERTLAARAEDGLEVHRLQLDPERVKRLLADRAPSPPAAD